jgi:hypothetical protein
VPAWQAAPAQHPFTQLDASHPGSAPPAPAVPPVPELVALVLPPVLGSPPEPPELVVEAPFEPPAPPLA